MKRLVWGLVERPAVLTLVLCALAGGLWRFVELVGPQPAAAAGVGSGGLANPAPSGRAAKFTASGSTPQFVCSGTGTCSWESATSAANASTSVASHTIAPTTTLDADDLILEVNAASGGTQVFAIDKEGDVILSSSKLCMNSSCNRYFQESGGTLFAIGTIRGSGDIAVTGSASFTNLTTDEKAVLAHGTTAMAIESGSGAMTAGALAVTFGTAFGAAPNCVCSHTNATPAACGISTAANTTTVTFSVASGGTDTVQWICMGTR